jgi:hypothetical protein
MDILAIILVAAVTFGACFALDKGFTKVFRGTQQHKTGLSVRLSKRYGSGGLLLAVLGLAAVFSGLQNSTLLLAGGIFLMLLGIGLIVYYMTFGVYYDADSFVLTTFGRKSETYAFREIKAQQLYTVTGGSTIIELHLQDGRTVSLQSTMTGVYPFLDAAFAAWCRQRGTDAAACSFHDPENSRWFPGLEEL